MTTPMSIAGASHSETPAIPTKAHCCPGKLSSPKRRLYSGLRYMAIPSSSLDRVVKLRALEQRRSELFDQPNHRLGRCVCSAVEHHQQVIDERAQDLDANRVLAAPRELPDPEVLPDLNNTGTPIIFCRMACGRLSHG